MCLCGLGACFGSCAGSFCAGCCCAGCSGECKAKHGPLSRIPYLFLFFISCLFAVIFTIYGGAEIWSNDLLDVNIYACSSASCKGNGTVYRTSFTLFIFFVVHWITVRFVPSFHWSFMMIKFGTFAIVLFITYFIDKDFFNAYASFARVASGVFLLLQVVVLIVWAYDVNDRLIYRLEELEKEVDNEEVETKGMMCMLQSSLLGGTIIINALSIIIWVLCFVWFVKDKSCSLQNALIIVTILLVLILTTISCIFPRASIFTSAIVSFYCTYLCYSALSAFPDDSCNQFADEKTSGSFWVGMLITAAAISYSGFAASKHASNLAGPRKEEDVELEATGRKTTDDPEEGNPEAVESNYDDEENKSEPDLPPDKLEADKQNNLTFHLCMAFASVYMAMLYTNWGTNTANSSTAQSRGRISLWVNIAAQWVTVVLYLWTLVAPKACPDRFGIDEEEED